MLRVFAPAKINLTLHVTGQRHDGYHLLDSLVAFADVGDYVTLRRQTGGGLGLTGPEAAVLATTGENIITRTLAAFDAGDVHVTLDKRLPIASGMGGGSADAAAVYRGLLALLPRGRQGGDGDRLLSLGADVPMCADCLPARVCGIGDQITPLPALATLNAVLVNPRTALPTPAVFQRLAQKANPPMPALPRDLAQAGALLPWLADQRNDLQPPAMALAPVIGTSLAALAASGARLARMSGSGATCFGLYDSAAAAQTAAAALAQDFPDWWIAPTLLNGPIAAAPQAIRATT